LQDTFISPKNIFAAWGTEKIVILILYGKAGLHRYPRLPQTQPAIVGRCLARLIHADTHNLQAGGQIRAEQPIEETAATEHHAI
jgi:hypothetical protein